LEASNWTSYLYRPIQVVSGPANKITLIVFTIIICCIIIILFVSYYLSSVLVRPLERLSNNMQQIESGDLTITVTDNSKDEIGHLIRSFGQMVNQLKYLIDEVYKGKITQQEYEMKALQSQINPHFFYNSLSLINSKAIMAGEEDISQMTQFLSTFYRTTLNKGKSIISIEDEWTNVVSYIHIQRMMHSNSFDAYYEIDENILNYTMPNLVLQPLVENAIEHGLDHKLTSGRAILNISGKQSDGNIVFLVSDNGPGMEAGLLENILNEETSGYGVQNVHRRIQLYYGENYGLSYDSSPDKGTRVTLTIPKQ
ncbi:MAG: sensor histidine kinase, partial [Epulopiscium sp.]|nr:sensor histidine kinase [Candidatus Epulonipiscium sp.]